MGYETCGGGPSGDYFGVYVCPAKPLIAGVYGGHLYADRTLLRTKAPKRLCDSKEGPGYGDLGPVSPWVRPWFEDYRTAGWHLFAADPCPKCQRKWERFNLPTCPSHIAARQKIAQESHQSPEGVQEDSPTLTELVRSLAGLWSWPAMLAFLNADGITTDELDGYGPLRIEGSVAWSIMNHAMGLGRDPDEGWIEVYELENAISDGGRHRSNVWTPITYPMAGEEPSMLQILHAEANAAEACYRKIRKGLEASDLARCWVRVQPMAFAPGQLWIGKDGDLTSRLYVVLAVAPDGRADVAEIHGEKTTTVGPRPDIVGGWRWLLTWPTVPHIGQSKLAEPTDEIAAAWRADMQARYMSNGATPWRSGWEDEEHGWD